MLSGDVSDIKNYVAFLEWIGVMVLLTALP